MGKICPTCEHSKKDLTVCPVCGFFDKECFKTNEIYSLVGVLIFIAVAAGIVVLISKSEIVALSLIGGLITFIGIPLLVFALIGLLFEMNNKKKQSKALQENPEYIFHSDITKRIQGVANCDNVYTLRSNYFNKKASKEFKTAIFNRIKAISSKDEDNKRVFKEIEDFKKAEKKKQYEQEQMQKVLSEPLHELPLDELVVTLNDIKGEVAESEFTFDDEYSRVEYICQTSNDFREILVWLRKIGFQAFQFSGDRTIISAKSKKGAITIWVPQDLVFGKGRQFAYMEDGALDSQVWTKSFNTPDNFATDDVLKK